MSDGNINPFDWYRRFFNQNRNFMRNFYNWDPFADFDEIENEMKKVFDQFKNIQSDAPKELVREYKNAEGNKVREVGPIIYGYSVTIGPDGKPRVREFGNVKTSNRGIKNQSRFGNIDSEPVLSAEREPLADITTTDKEIKVILEMPGVRKEDILINAYDSTIEIISNDPKRRYHRTVEVPPEANIETVRSTYNNGILELTFDKKTISKPKGRQIKVD